MKKLSRKDVNKMLHEEMDAIVSRKILEQSKSKIRKIRNQMISEGVEKQRVDENIMSLLSGLAQRAAGLGLSDFAPVGDSEGVLGGMSQGMRVAIEQMILETLVSRVGLDPYSGFGLTLKNIFEQVLKKYSTGQLTSMLTSQGDCKTHSFNIAREVLEILEETEKERILGIAIKAVAGEFGSAFQTSKLTKPLYQNIRERFSEAFDPIFDEEALAADLSDVICDNFTLDNVLKTARDYTGETITGAFGELAGAFNNLKPEFT